MIHTFQMDWITNVYFNESWVVYHYFVPLAIMYSSKSGVEPIYHLKQHQ